MYFLYFQILSIYNIIINTFLFLHVHTKYCQYVTLSSILFYSYMYIQYIIVLLHIIIYYLFFKYTAKIHISI